MAEHEAAIRVGIRLAIEADGFVVCAEPLDAAAAVADAAATRPSACLLDERLPGGALSAVAAIHRADPATRLLLLTSSEQPDDLLAAVRAGASGFLRTDLDPARLGTTIHGVLAGEAALSRRQAHELMVAFRTTGRRRPAPTTPGGPPMTDRELEVLELLTQGLRTSEMAARLSIADVTVRRHVSSALTKMGVTDRAAAIAVLSGSAAVQ